MKMKHERLYIALVWLGLILLCLVVYAFTSPAQARHRHAGGCAHGQIKILHSGACVSRATAAEEGYIRPRRMSRREERRATHAAEKALHNHGIVYVKVIDASQEPQARTPPSPPAPEQLSPCGETPATDVDTMLPFVIRQSRMGSPVFSGWQF
jgi:hypothetical protein